MDITLAYVTVIGSIIAIIGSVYALYRGWRDEQRKLREENRIDERESVEMQRLLQDGLHALVNPLTEQNEKLTAELARVRATSDTCRSDLAVLQEDFKRCKRQLDKINKALQEKGDTGPLGE